MILFYEVVIIDKELKKIRYKKKRGKLVYKD